MDYICVYQSEVHNGESIYQGAKRAGICPFLFLQSTKIDVKCSAVVVVAWSLSGQVHERRL